MSASYAHLGLNVELCSPGICFGRPQIAVLLAALELREVVWLLRRRVPFLNSLLLGKEGLIVLMRPISGLVPLCCRHLDPSQTCDTLGRRAGRSATHLQRCSPLHACTWSLCNKKQR